MKIAVIAVEYIRIWIGWFYKHKVILSDHKIVFLLLIFKSLFNALWWWRVRLFFW